MIAPAMASRDEEQLVAHYLVHRRSHPRCSQVRPEHLQDPVLRAAWQRALARDDWTDTDLGISLERFNELADHRVPPGLFLALERKLVAEWSRRRLIVSGGAALQELAAGADLGEIVSTLREILGETESGSLTSSRPIGDEMRVALEEWATACTTKEHRRTIPLPLHDLRRRLGGWVRGRLHIVGGRTSEHKTTFARMSAWYPAQHGFRTLFYTLEDRGVDIAARTIAAEIQEFDVGALVTGVMPDRFPPAPDARTEIFDRAQALAASEAAQNMRVLDRAGATLSQLLGTFRAEAARGTALAVIDYLQLIEHDRGGDRDAGFWRSVSSGLHRVAKETSMAIIATSQIDKIGQRQTDSRGIPEPSAMLFSGPLQQDAFGVIMLGKPNRNNPDSRAFEIQVKKWKSGPTFPVQLTVVPGHDLIMEGFGPGGVAA